MTRTADELALLRAIREQPDDDALRLAYADYLDGLDTVSVPCPTCGPYRDDPCPYCNGQKHVTIFKGPGATNPNWKDCDTCGGTGKFPVGYHPERDPASGRQEGGWTNCKTCNGGGKPSTPGVQYDTSNRDRAELIRVQCERHRISHGVANVAEAEECWQCWCARSGAQRTNGQCRCSARFKAMLAREKELLAANADRWRKGSVCERCGGNALENGTNPYQECRFCFDGDAGGLMRVVGYDKWKMRVVGYDKWNEEHGAPRRRHDYRHAVDYVRGMKRVHATSADLWASECPTCEHTRDLSEPCAGCGRMNRHESRPTPWLLAVCAHHPDVVEMWVDDLEPFPTLDHKLHSWARHGTGNAQIPKILFDLIPSLNRYDSPMLRFFATADAARTALARAVVRWAHAFLSPNGSPV